MKLTKKTCWRIGLTAFLLYLAIYYWPTVAKFVSVLLGAAVPLILGGAIAYAVNILMSFYERHLFKKATGKAAALRRPVCMLAAILSVLFVLYFVVRLVVPEFLSCVNALIKQAPAAVNKLLQNPYVQKLIPPDIEEKLAAMDWPGLVSKARGVLLSGVSGAAAPSSTDAKWDTAGQ